MDIGRLYRERFDVAAFLSQYYSTVHGRIEHQLTFFHDSFKDLPNGVRVLEYGAGPTLMCTISAATKASEIVLAEYAEKNRNALNLCLSADPEAFDWSPQFNFVVKQLEGKSDKDVAERKELVGKVVKSVVPCNITKVPSIQEEYNKEYDVVISCFLVEAVATNVEELKLYITRIGSFVKPGGKILYYGVENRAGYFTVGNERFPNIHATAEFIIKILESVGFQDLLFGKYKPKDDPNRDYQWISGRRST